MIIAIGEIKPRAECYFTEFIKSHERLYGPMLSLFKRFYCDYETELQGVISDIMDESLFHHMIHDWLGDIDGYDVDTELDVLKNEGEGRSIDSIFLNLMSQQFLVDGFESRNENIHVLFFLLFKAACDRKIKNPALFYYRGELFLGEIRRDVIDDGHALTQCDVITLFDEDHSSLLVDFHYEGIKGTEYIQYEELLGSNTIAVYDVLPQDTV